MENKAEQPLSILVAEDTRSTLRIIQRFLGILGYPSDAAVDGIEAVEYFKRKTYDLVFMDIQMPGMDGITATDKIKRHLTHLDRPHPFFIAQTSEIKKEQESRYHKVGFDKTILKPTTIEKLRYGVELAIQRKIYLQDLHYTFNRDFAKTHPLSVLIVEDKEFQAAATKAQLKTLGYNPETIENGYDAIEMFNQGVYYDVILMDIRMPKIDGFRTTDLVRETFYNQMNRICPTFVATSSLEYLKDNDMYREGRFDNHLVKPIEIGKLAHVLFVAYQRKLILQKSINSTSESHNKQNSFMQGQNQRVG